MGKFRRHFKKHEIEFLKQNARFMTLGKLAKNLGRTKISVTHKLSYLKLKTEKFFSYKTKHKISNLNKSYIAGAIDGEGCITFSYRAGKERWIRPLILILNTNFKWLKRIQKELGIGTVYLCKKAYKKNWKPQHRFQVTDRKARWLASQLFPFLRIKKKQAELLLAFPRGHRKTPLRRKKQERLLKKMRLLNRRGIHNQSSL